LEFLHKITYSAQAALLLEVTATPKPGLVDRNNSGAHTDMNIFTFMQSIAALGSYFGDYAQMGIEYNGDCLEELFSNCRTKGLAAEKSMYQVTNNVNTHKGALFSLGLISLAAGYLYNHNSNENLLADEICTTVAIMSAGICKNELINLDAKTDKKLTNGEKQYLKYGLQGIRGEVESGFKTVRKVSLPLYRELTQESTLNINDKLLQVLFSLMAVTEDTTIVARHDLQTLQNVQNDAKTFLQQKGMYAKDAYEKLASLDKKFITQNISPGGSADLLSVTIMLGMLESIQL